MDDHVRRELLDQTPDAVIFAGTDGMISYWNDAAERIFGFPTEKALGESLDLIIPEQFREAHWKGFERARNNLCGAQLCDREGQRGEGPRGARHGP